MSLLFQDDVGATLIISTNNTTIPETATLTLVVEKPGLDVVTWAITTPMIDYATGVITYTTGVGDLDEVGEYRLQVHGVFVDGSDYTSNIDSFTVNEKIE